MSTAKVVLRVLQHPLLAKDGAVFYTALPNLHPHTWTQTHEKDANVRGKSSKVPQGPDHQSSVDR